MLQTLTIDQKKRKKKEKEKENPTVPVSARWVLGVSTHGATV